MSVKYGVLKRLPVEKRLDISKLDLMVSNWVLLLDAETLATLCAASSEHSAATLGGHTSTEAVALSALAVVRLIGAFHLSFPFIFKE